LTLNIDLKSSRCIIPAGSKIIINKASILDQRIVIVLTHWNNSPRVNMSLHSHTFCWFRANLSLCSFFIIYVQKWRLVDSWTFTNIFSQYKQQLTNGYNVITNQTFLLHTQIYKFECIPTNKVFLFYIFTFFLIIRNLY
jgi:hypothetical protein